MLTEPKTALAGVMLEAPFATFMASMVTFNVDKAPSRRFSMIESRDSYENQRSWQAVRNGPSPNTNERPRADRTFDKRNRIRSSGRSCARNRRPIARASRLEVDHWKIQVSPNLSGL